MRDRTIARRLEAEIQAELAATATGSSVDLQGHLSVVKALQDLGAEWRHHAETRSARDVQSCLDRYQYERTGPRRPHWRSRQVAVSAFALVTVLMFAFVPGLRTAVAQSFVGLLQLVRVGEYTEIARLAPQTEAEIAAHVDRFESGLATGQRWSVQTNHYGRFGGSVPTGESATVRRIDSLPELLSATDMDVLVPTHHHRGDLVQFDHAFIAPGGLLLVFFGARDNELLLVQAPVGEGRGIGFSRTIVKTGSDGRRVSESPALEVDEFVLNGQTVVWDPDTTGRLPGTSALRWEANAVSYSLMGRALERKEAEEVFVSLRPVER